LMMITMRIVILESVTKMTRMTMRKRSRTAEKIKKMEKNLMTTDKCNK
jgi:hypothetical protein